MHVTTMFYHEISWLCGDIRPACYLLSVQALSTVLPIIGEYLGVGVLSEQWSR